MKNSRLGDTEILEYRQCLASGAEVPGPAFTTASLTKIAINGGTAVAIVSLPNIKDARIRRNVYKTWTGCITTFAISICKLFPMSLIVRANLWISPV